MTHNISLDREIMAIAACDIAGVERPLSSDMPEGKRQYLYARPDGEDEKFSTNDLSEKLRQCGVQFGVQWDSSKENFGLRFVSSDAPLPIEIRPYTSPEAHEQWNEWRRENIKMSSLVSDAAARTTRGENIEFTSEDIPLMSKKSRRRVRLGERD